VIPKYEIDTEITVRGMGEDWRMDSPEGPSEVVWYDFTNLPGAGGNAVFSGHLDWHTGKLGVFWNLKDLVVGDSIEVVMSDGTVYRYQMSQSWVVEAAADFAKIVGPTNREVVTLITCSGTFVGGLLEYSHRLIVQAKRVYPESKATEIN
jgi:LPXTG-site transpeptidase (sortase) family protein